MAAAGEPVTLDLGRIGLGCMGMSDGYGEEPDTPEAVATLARALELGVRLFDTADVYGQGANERLVGRELADAQRAGRALIATKFGFVRDPESGEWQGVCGTPAYVRSCCERSLSHLGLEHIDLYYQHRVDPEVPIEETVGEMARLVEEGKVRHLGLSEAAPATIRRAHGTHPIAAVQTEYALWSREVEAAVLPTCRELGIRLVAYSPLGRGMLTGSTPNLEATSDEDFRKTVPRFLGENLERNVALADEVRAIARELGATAAQVALAWLLARGEDVVPIPGTKRRSRLEENLGARELELGAAELERLDALPPAAGDRYGEAVLRGVDL